MYLTDIISKSEEKYLSSIEAFFIRKWGDTKLWSHDLSHHRRVWNYAKELLQYTGIPDGKFVEKLLIACYLHDLGMTVDREEIHGIHSKKFCELFLEEKNINPADYADLFDAIENHDNKDYTHKPTANRLLQILSIADDLDAFGYTGILRYADIYLERGVSMSDLGRQVIENSSKRFINFEKTFSEFPELVEKHRKRFSILKIFYSSFDREN
ncbi:MAG: HD domain-containing protein [Bacteroidales bacterium]|nr:HD domain-containing protein [Bacteroidales bacterium]